MKTSFIFSLFVCILCSCNYKNQGEEAVVPVISLDCNRLWGKFELKRKRL